MSLFPPFPEGQIESLARLLGECGTGDQITRALHDRGLEDHSGQSTKWRRLHWVFSHSQRQHGCANRIIDFIQAFLAPGRFVGNSSEFEDHRTKLKATFKQFRVPRSHFRVPKGFAQFSECSSASALVDHPVSFTAFSAVLPPPWSMMTSGNGLLTLFPGGTCKRKLRLRPPMLMVPRWSPNGSGESGRTQQTTSDRANDRAN